MTHQTPLDHFCVVDLGDDEVDHIPTTVITPEHTPIPTIYQQTLPAPLSPGLMPLVDASPQCLTWFGPSALAAEKKTWSPDDWESRNLGKLSDYQNSEAGFPVFHIQNAMAQEMLSHRKVIAEDLIEMNDLSGSHVGPTKSLEATAKTCPQGVMEESKDTRTKKQKATERIQFAAVCWCLFLAGWNDGTTGPLLPRIQEVYHVCLSGFLVMYFIAYLYLGQLYNCIFDFYLCLSCRSLLSLSISTVDHQVTGFHPGSSC